MTNSRPPTARSAHQLAVKYHPDKCHQPRAEEVFKKISAAYQTLSDETKRRRYDQSPHDTNIFGDHRRASSSFREGQYGDFDDFFTAEDLFFHMFTGMDPGVRRRRRGEATHFHTGGFSQAQTPPSPQKALLQFLPLILILVFSVVLGWGNRPAYSFTPSSSNNQALFTRTLNVPFYAGDKFMKMNSVEKERIYQQIEGEYFENLREGCTNEYYSRRYWGERDLYGGSTCKKYLDVKRRLGI